MFMDLFHQIIVFRDDLLGLGCRVVHVFKEALDESPFAEFSEDFLLSNKVGIASPSEIKVVCDDQVPYTRWAFGYTFHIALVHVGVVVLQFCTLSRCSCCNVQQDGCVFWLERMLAHDLIISRYP